MSKRSAVKADVTLGQRIRVRRVEAGLSQSELGATLGVSFQQVQKYEKGINRVGAARLSQIAKALKVSVTYFYDEANGKQQEVESLIYADPAHCLRLLRAYHAMDLNTARNFVSLMERVVNTYGEGLSQAAE